MALQRQYVLPPPPNPDDDVNGYSWRDWFRQLRDYIVNKGLILWSQIDFTGSNIKDIVTRKHNDLQSMQGGNSLLDEYYHLTGVEYTGTGTGVFVRKTGATIQNPIISGGSIDNTTIGSTTPSSGHFTSDLQRDGYTVKPNCYIEVYDRSATYPVTSTPTLLKPVTTGSYSGITYDSSTGEFTFLEEGSYSLALVVNAIASAAGQTLYIYAEKNTGSGWTLNANSGKVYQLPNAQQIQIVYAQAVHRDKNEKTRYYIYSNDSKVQLETATLPSTSTVYVPAIRIQYS